MGKSKYTPRKVSQFKVIEGKAVRGCGSLPLEGKGVCGKAVCSKLRVNIKEQPRARDGND